MYSPKSMLITGAAGFIGSHFVDYSLQQAGVERVISVDSLTYAGNLLNLEQAEQDARHQFVKADINDIETISHLLQQHEIDTIVNFAAESHVDRSIDGPETFVMTNVVGTFRLLEAARKVWQNNKDDCRFHHISTDEVYGTLEKDAPAFSETTPYAPSSPYSASKAASDHFINAYFSTYDLPVITTNCSNNYGPRQYPEKLIPVIINSALNEQPIPIYGDGSNIRDWLYVEDHCAGIWSALTQGELGRCYNIGGDCEIDNLSLAKTICQLLDTMKPRAKGSYAELIHFVTDRPGHDWRYAIDHKRLSDLTGWQPAHALEAALSKTISHYLNLWKPTHAI